MYDYSKTYLYVRSANRKFGHQHEKFWMAKLSVSGANGQNYGRKGRSKLPLKKRLGVNAKF